MVGVLDYRAVEKVVRVLSDLLGLLARDGCRVFDPFVLVIGGNKLLVDLTCKFLDFVLRELAMELIDHMLDVGKEL